MAGKIFIRSAIGVAVVIAAYAVVGYLVVPRAVHWAVSSYLPRILGEADVRIGDVSFNPWSWDLQIKDIQAHSKKHPNDLSVSLASLNIDLNSATLFTLSPVADALHIDGLNAHFSDALLTDAAAAASPTQKSSTSSDKKGKLPAFAFSNIAITNSNLTFVNTKNQAKAEITDIRFILPVLSTMEHEGALSSVTSQLSLKVNGTLVQTTAKATQSGGEVKLKLDHLDIAAVLRALPLYLPYIAKTATISLDSTVTFQFVSKGLPHIQASGSANLSDIEVVQDKGLPFFSAQTITANWSNLMLLGPEIQKGSLTMAAGNLDLRNEKGDAFFRAQNLAAAIDGIAWKNSALSFTAAASSATAAEVFNPVDGKTLLSTQKINASSAGFSLVNEAVRVHDVKVSMQNLRFDAQQEGLGEIALQSLSASSQTLTSQKEQIILGNGNLQVKRLNIRNQDGTPMVAIDSVQTSLENFDSVKRTMAVRDMEIGQPQLWYVRKSAAHGKEMGNKKQTTPSPDYNKRWHYRIGSIMLDKGSVNFLDESIRPAGRLRIDNIRGELKNLNSAAGEARYSIAASLASGGMESKGTIALAPSIQVKADTDLSHLELSTFNPWLTALSNTRFAQGAVDSNGSLHITKTNPLQLSWQGNTQIHHLDVRHASSGVQYVGWNDAQANGIRLTSLSPVDVQINKLHVTGLTQKNINQVKQAANLLGFIGALTGNKKLTSSANSALIDSITLNNISYGPSGFKLGGSIGNGLESLLLGNLNSFLTKLPR